MPLGPDPQRARAVLAGLAALRDTVATSEDDVLACLVVTGEPRPQRVLDDWLDQVADTLRALGETAADISPSLARRAARAERAPSLGDGAGGASASADAASDTASDTASDAASDAGLRLDPGHRR